MDSKNNYYDCLKVICNKRKSIRHFEDQEVYPRDIEKIKEIAYTSPYASGRKNWELVVVTDREKIEKIAEVVRIQAVKLKGIIREDFKESFMQYAKSFTKFEGAPVLIIPTFRISPTLSLMLTKSDEQIALWERDNYVKSISCVVMLILLAAESLGLGACYMTGPLIAKNDISKIINVKKGREIGAIIPIGHPKKEK